MHEPDDIDPADWATIWQSELAALAVDREGHEALAAWGRFWNQIGAPTRDGAAGQARPDAPAGAAAAGDAPGAAMELDELRRRVAELERAARDPA